MPAGRRHVPVAQPRRPELGGRRSCRRHAIFRITSGTPSPGIAHIDLAVEGVSCAGCMAKIERGLSAIPDVTRARVNLTDRRAGAGMAERARSIRRGSSIASPSSATRPIRSSRSAPKPSRREQSRLPAALPRRRRLRRHERDDAVGPGMVRQRHRHAAGAARFLSLAVGADRAAGGGLCRPAVLPIGVAGAPRRRRQHGRADQHRRRPGARRCR